MVNNFGIFRLVFECLFWQSCGMSSAVNDLQRAILGDQQSLTQLLRQTKVIAANLDLTDIKEWVHLELAGYPQDSEPPEYREFFAQTLECRHPMYGWQFAGHLGIPIKARFPISEIEDYSKGNTLVFPVPQNFSLRDQLGMTLDWPQRFCVAGSQFKGIVDAVTNELLNWTTELQKRGIKGENMDFNENEKRTAGGMVFNIGTVHGAVGNVSNSPVTFYDNKTINQLFAEKNIPKHDRRELEDILDEMKDAQPIKRKSLVARAEELVLKHKEALGAAAEIITKTIRAAVE